METAGDTSLACCAIPALMNIGWSNADGEDDLMVVEDWNSVEWQFALWNLALPVQKPLVLGQFLYQILPPSSQQLIVDRDCTAPTAVTSLLGPLQAQQSYSSRSR